MRAIIAGFALLLAALSGRVDACTLSLQGGIPVYALVYDPFSPTPARLSAVIQIKNEGSKPCDAAIAFFSQAGKASSGSHSISYSVSGAAGGDLINAGASASSDVKAGKFLPLAQLAPRENRSVTFELTASPGQIVPPETYVDDLQIVVYESRGGSPIGRISALQRQVRIAAKPVVSVNLAGGGQTTALDFGILSTGATRAAQLQARSNIRFSLVAMSENGGALKLDPPATDGGSWQAPYTVRINGGADLTLSANKKVELGVAATSLEGIAVPVEVRIGGVDGQRAGHYRDVITVQIAADP